MTNPSHDGAHFQSGRLAASFADEYLKLARDPRLWVDDLDDALRKILVVVGRTLAVEQIGVWGFNERRDTITQKIQLDTARDQFTHGLELCRQDYPRRFAALEASRFIAAADALASSWEQEFADWKNDVIHALMDCGIFVGGEQWGVLYIGHVGSPREWMQDEIWFATSVADLIGLLVTHDHVRHGRNELRFVSDNLPVGIIKLDSDGNCLEANPCWRVMAGVPDLAAACIRWLEFIHPDDRDKLRALVCDVATLNEPSECECRLITPANDVIWVACRWVPLLDQSKSPNGVLGTFDNIMRQRAAFEHEHRYRMLFENYTDAIFLIRGALYVDCNDRALAMFGCTREQMLSDIPYRFSPDIQPDGQSSIEKALEKISAAFAGERQLFEWQHLRYDGTPFDTEVAMNAVMLDGEPHLLTTLRDVSEHRRSQQALAESHRRLSRINQAAERLYGRREVAGVAEETVSLLVEYAGVSLAWFYRYDETAQIAELVAYRDPLGLIAEPSTVAQRWSGALLPDQGEDFVAWSDPADLPEDMQARGEVLRRGTQSLALMWLREDGRRIGTIALEYSTRTDFAEADRKDIVAFAKVISMALANALAIARSEKQAAEDLLTGLPNRLALRQELTRLGERGGLLLLDLDRFKEINDTLGHHMGDKLLIELSRRLRHLLNPEHNFFCRLGGDEFAILVRNETPAEISRTALRLLRSLGQPFQIDNLRLEVGGSIGVAVYPRDSTDGHDLLRFADVAMYEAKRTGARVAFYDRSVDEHSLQRLAIMQELRAGVSRAQMVLHYQPKLDLVSGRIDGFEALVRWQHPQRGMLSPADFVPLAEVTDVIHSLTNAVLNIALMQLRKWCDRGLHYSIAVNLSPRNLLNRDCFDRVESLLHKYGIDPSLLELEITESTLMHDPDGVIRLLKHLSSIGVRFSIDDFGTGYSSLSYLRRLPIHALKIDRAFVTDMLRSEADEVIVRSTIALAHNLKLDVIAEGVEDLATQEALRQMGCDRAQGYFIGKPQPESAIDGWLIEWEASSGVDDRLLGANI